MEKSPSIAACSARPSALDPEEFREMADHTTVGHQIVSSVQFPWPKIPETVRWHHERSDGSGYPDKLAQDDLPMQVRIVGLADSFDAMTSARPYRAPLSVGSALSDLVRMAPDKYDPNVVQGLLIQVRRDAVGSNRAPLLDSMPVNIAAADIDQLAATLQHKVSRGKMYLTKENSVRSVSLLRSERSVVRPEVLLLLPHQIFPEPFPNTRRSISTATFSAVIQGS